MEPAKPSDVAVLDLESTERAIARSSVANRSRRDVIIASGPDASSYLHGQVSQNITRLGIGESTRTLLLSPQGRIDAWTRVTRVGAETYWLDVDPGFGAAMLARLDRFKLRTKATFELLEASSVEVRGPGSPERATLDATSPEPDVIDAELCWGDRPGFDRIGRSVTVPTGVALGHPAAFEAARIVSGLPAMGTELREKTIPAEIPGLVEASVDFAKGCYVGQELVARIDSRGNNTPRRLWSLTSTSAAPVPAAGVAVSDDESEVGTITSAAPLADGRYVALASMGRAFDEPRPVRVAGAAADVHALVGTLG